MKPTTTFLGLVATTFFCVVTFASDKGTDTSPPVESIEPRARGQKAQRQPQQPAPEVKTTPSGQRIVTAPPVDSIPAHVPHRDPRGGNVYVMMQRGAGGTSDSGSTAEARPQPKKEKPTFCDFIKNNKSNLFRPSIHNVHWEFSRSFRNADQINPNHLVIVFEPGPGHSFGAAVPTFVFNKITGQIYTVIMRNKNFLDLYPVDLENVVGDLDRYTGHRYAETHGSSDPAKMSLFLCNTYPTTRFSSN